MKNLRLCFARPCRADALLRQVEIAQTGAEHRDSKGNLLPLSPDADLRLVTLAAQHIYRARLGEAARLRPERRQASPLGLSPGGLHHGGARAAAVDPRARQGA